MGPERTPPTADQTQLTQMPKLLPKTQLLQTVKVQKKPFPQNHIIKQKHHPPLRPSMVDRMAMARQRRHKSQPHQFPFP